MAKTVTRRVPGQSVTFDPMRTIKKVHWGDDGVWCSIRIYIGNQGEGGNAQFTIGGLVTSFLFGMGFDGFSNENYRQVRGNDGIIPSPNFNHVEPLGDGNGLTQLFGVAGFDAGDAHEGTELFIKMRKKTFTAHFTNSSMVHTPVSAFIWDSKDIKDPFAFFANRTARAQAAATSVGSSWTIDFNTDKDNPSVSIH